MVSRGPAATVVGGRAAAAGVIHMTDCFVSDEDYQRHWLGRNVIVNCTIHDIAYDGVNRRSGSERRGDRDRRWDAARGRRYRLLDRRRRR